MKQPPLIYQGKVRDIYDEGDTLLLVATNRLSAFDRPIAEIPYKAEVLNQLSAWWFEKTRYIIDNHFIALPTPTSMRVKKAQVFPIEMVVRGYVTGTTNTSIWTLYQQGERHFFETTLPDGLQKNSALPQPILTPTSKAADHDVPLTVDDIKSADYMTPAQWELLQKKALELFQFGQKVAREHGLILVDTKYEFGLTDTGQVMLIDECHTPDSSRYWLLHSYQAAFAEGKEPENFDKEMLRLWFRKHSDPYHDKILPTAPLELVEQLSARYQEIYQRLTNSALWMD